MAGLVQRLPFPLSGRTTAASASFALSGITYDFALAGQPWLSAIDREHPMTRAGAELRKDQFDNQAVPGEQSLANWWLRSQSTFIGGAGLLYQDPSTDNQYAIRYGESVGVNPWVNGRLALLRRTAERIDDASADRGHVLGWNDGTDRFWYAVGAQLKSDTGSATTTITWGGAGTILSLTSDGTNYFAADNVQVYKGAGNGVGAAWTATGVSSVLARWVKGRIMLGLNHELHECSGAGVKTLKFTHLNTAWRWTDMCEGTNAIYAAGYAGARSDIFKLTLDTNGTVPALAAGGALAAQLPHGEIVHSLTSYLGTFVGIGTNRGFRVGTIDENGDLEYGPLLVENISGCKAAVGYDRFFFVGATNSITGKSGLHRIDLGQPITAGDISPAVRFAYASDLQTGVTGEVSSVSLLGTSDRLVMAVTGQGAYLEHATEKESTGYITTGRIRFNTLEPKIYKAVSVKTPSDLKGSVSVSVIDPGGAETPLLTTSEGSGVVIKDLLLAAPAAAVEWIQLKLTLNRSSVNLATGGELDGWQLKAMPGATRQRTMTIPLRCYDKEETRTGKFTGRTGRALERLRAFEEIFARGDAVAFQDLRNQTSDLVVIDDYRFEQKVQPANKAGYGGVLWVELRTIADVVA